MSPPIRLRPPECRYTRHKRPPDSAVPRRRSERRCETRVEISERWQIERKRIIVLGRQKREQPPRRRRKHGLELRSNIEIDGLALSPPIRRHRGYTENSQFVAAIVEAANTVEEPRQALEVHRPRHVQDVPEF